MKFSPNLQIAVSRRYEVSCVISLLRTVEKFMTSVQKLPITDLGVQPQQDNTKENGETVHQVKTSRIKDQSD